MMLWSSYSWILALYPVAVHRAWTTPFQGVLLSLLLAFLSPGWRFCQRYLRCHKIGKQTVPGFVDSRGECGRKLHIPGWCDAQAL